jgi:hypothetical protein
MGRLRWVCNLCACGAVVACVKLDSLTQRCVWRRGKWGGMPGGGGSGAACRRGGGGSGRDVCRLNDRASVWACVQPARAARCVCRTPEVGIEGLLELRGV